MVQGGGVPPPCRNEVKATTWGGGARRAAASGLEREGIHNSPSQNHRVRRPRLCLHLPTAKRLLDFLSPAHVRTGRVRGVSQRQPDMRASPAVTR